MFRIREQQEPTKGKRPHSNSNPNLQAFEFVFFSFSTFTFVSAVRRPPSAIRRRSQAGRAFSLERVRRVGR